ncbi:MAG: DUF3152 domain-containing protein [Actinobacteria bacterium]|nr:DUF3152 domain-containing protein [Actinomycetota bacterium]MCA1720168.1 DUF3152 domain-containing protein [Actinomycetota bacterium]
MRVLLACCGLLAAGLVGQSADAPVLPVVHRPADVVHQGVPGPVPVPAAAPAAPPSAPPGRVVQRGTGRLNRVPGTSAVAGTGPLQTYEVLVEGGIGIDGPAFVAAVERVLADPRSWTAGGRRSLQRVDAAADLRIVLASPDTTDDLCAPLRTVGRLSCGSGRTAVLNARRWLTGAPAYAGRLDAYRTYLVNHEVGHTLGRGHAGCPGRGRPAPVMMQQTLTVGRCRPSAWPFP